MEVGKHFFTKQPKSCKNKVLLKSEGGGGNMGHCEPFLQWSPLEEQRETG